MARRIIGIIPARGGSQSIENKNLREIAGHPLVCWAIASALQACDEVVVTSEDSDIAQVATRFAPSVLMVYRPHILSQPTTPDLPVIQEAYDHVRTLMADDVLVLLRPTSPFRKPEEIRAVAELVNPMYCDSVRSVVRATEHPAKMYRETGWVNPAWSPSTEASDFHFPMLEGWSERHHRPNHPRQFLPKAWRACGFVDAVRGETVRAGSLEGDLILGWPVDPERSVDIDTEEDLQRADQLARAKGWKPGDIA